jgi:hypothetical protein
MPSLRFKGRVFVENFHLGVPFHELTPVRARGLSPKASLHDNLIVEGDNLLALKALLHRWHHVPATAVRDLRIGRQTGTMILKEYQKRVLDRVGELVERLVEWRDKAEKVREIDPDFDWVRRAWEKTAPSRPYLSRRNGLREPLPSFCLKVPTGGGKTLLAIKVIDCVNTRYRRRQTGLVLWIVPSAQIYTQTQRALRDRDHPYRQQLDVASAGRTLVLEKTSGFGRRDVEERLCVLLLMLPSANRETKEQLRMFRDAGGFDRFFPPDDDADAHRDLRARVPNLDAFEQSGGVWGEQILTNPGSRSALTQLVGRILRQPYAAKTRVAALDESYVFCFRRRGADLLSEVRKGFGLEGLQGLEGRIASDEDGVPAGAPLISRQRERYRRAAADLVLPAFMIRDGRQWRLVHYETDILSRVPWDDTRLSPLFDVELGAGSRDVELRAGLDVHPLNTMSGATAVAAAAGADTGEDRIDYYFAAGHLLDAMPNPWRGAEAARRVFDALLKRYPRERVAANYLFVLEELRKQLEKERDRLSRQVFAELLEAGVMRFVVVADDLTFNRLPQRIEAPGARQANREDGGRYQHNLLDVITEEELNGLENKVATYLDTQARLFFWYRNRARRDYYVQGWEPGRIYADFILTLKPDEPDVGDEYHRVFVVETKGVHLGGSEDTEYKRSVFDVCSEHARKTNWAEFVPAMRNKVMRFEVVGEKEWEQRLNAMLAG